MPQVVQWYDNTGVLGGTLWILVLNLFFFRIVEKRYFKEEETVEEDQDMLKVDPNQPTFESDIK